jgi:hypothetical protein
MNRAICGLAIPAGHLFVFLVMGAPKDTSFPKVSKDGLELSIGMAVSVWLLDESRLQAAHSNVPNLSRNTNKAAAFMQVTASITNNIEDGDEHLLAKPMNLKLPFKVEEEIAHWEILAFELADDDFKTEMGSRQFSFILAVDLVGVEKIKLTCKSRGFCKFTTSSQHEPMDGAAESV